jgi:hypothetical protein
MARRQGADRNSLVGVSLGGKRPYFVCPGVVNGNDCARTVVKLYCAGRYYLCRHCYRLAYASQAEDRWDRASRRANKHRRRLGGETGGLSEIPERPKGMWHRSYQRLLSEIFSAEEEAEERLVLLVARLMKTSRKRKRDIGDESYEIWARRRHRNSRNWRSLIRIFG